MRIPLQRDCFIVVIQNLGFDKLGYVVLRRIRAIYRFGFLFVLFSYVERASTCSRSLWFLVAFSCRIDYKIFLSEHTSVIPCSFIILPIFCTFSFFERLVIVWVVFSKVMVDACNIFVVVSTSSASFPPGFFGRRLGIYTPLSTLSLLLKLLLLLSLSSRSITWLPYSSVILFWSLPTTNPPSSPNMEKKPSHCQ